jgi:hypothetical protein
MPTGTTHGVNTLEDRSAPAPDKLPLSSLAPRQAQTVRNQAWPSTCSISYGAVGYGAGQVRRQRVFCSFESRESAELPSPDLTAAAAWRRCDPGGRRHGRGNDMTPEDLWDATLLETCSLRSSNLSRQA